MYVYFFINTKTVFNICFIYVENCYGIILVYLFCVLSSV